MIILKPYYSHIDPDNPYTTHLSFEGRRSKRFYMRGSIAWPEGNDEGFALMAGYDLETRKTIIFEQFPFWTVSHWLNDDQTIRQRRDGQGYHLGLVQFIQDNLSLYKCCSYFWGCQHVDIFTRFATEVYKNPMTSRKIELIEVPYVKENGTGVLLERLKTQSFKGAAESMLSESIEQFVKMQTTKEGEDNKVLALKTLLCGYNFQPWVDVGDNI